jgi:tetratricopeptide (TPR) repeat protein
MVAREPPERLNRRNDPNAATTLRTDDVDGELINGAIAIAVLGIGGYGIVRLIKHLSEQADGAGEREVQKRLGAGDKLGAARAAYENEMWGRAATLFKDAGRLADAARAHKKGGDWENAANVFEKLKDYESAAWCFRKLKNDRSELEMLKAGKNWVDAARLAMKLGRKSDAAELLVCAGDREKAAELFRQAGEQGRAMALAAEIFEERGEFENAARSYAKIEDWDRAYALFNRAGKTDMAAKVLIRTGKRAEAADLYAAAGKHEVAAAMYEHLEQYRKAAALYSKLGQAENAIRCLMREGDRLAVIKLRIAGGNIDDAMRLAESIDPTEPEFIEAMEIAADLHEQQDNQTEALKNLNRLIQAPLKPEAKRKFTKRAIELCVDLQQPRLGSILLGKLEEMSGDTDGHIDEEWSQSVRSQFGEMKEEAPDDLRYLTSTVLRQSGGLVRVGGALGSDATSAFIEGTVAYIDSAAESGENAVQFGTKVSDDGWPQGVPEALSKRYSGLERLGQGGNGVVFRATDRLMDRTVVLKFMIDGSMPSEMARKYFMREIKMSASLSHPNIVHIYDMGQEDDIPYYSMEYIEGLPLTAHLPAGEPVADPEFLIKAVDQLCQALDHAHSKGMIHRDIKPDNVLVSTEGTCKLLDFGLARVLDDGFGENSVLAGTPYYMAPEQIDGSDVDHRADIYALGVIIFRMFTGHLPFTEGNIFVAHALEPVPDPKQYNPGLDEAVIDVIYRCMEKDPADRYTSSLEIAHDLGTAMFGTSTNLPDTSI